MDSYFALWCHYHCFTLCHTYFVVAVQCLETAFDVSTDDQSLAVTQTLPEIFASATPKVKLQKIYTHTHACNDATECEYGQKLCHVSYLVDCVFLLQHPDTPQVKINTNTDPPTEEEVAEAERLKTDGRTSSTIDLPSQLHLHFSQPTLVAIILRSKP